MNLLSPCSPLSFIVVHAELMSSLHGSFTEKGINVRATGGCINGFTTTGSLSLFILYQRHLIRLMGMERTMLHRLKKSLLDESLREAGGEVLCCFSVGGSEWRQCIFLFMCFIFNQKDNFIQGWCTGHEGLGDGGWEQGMDFKSWIITYILPRSLHRRKLGEKTVTRMRTKKRFQIRSWSITFPEY